MSGNCSLQDAYLDDDDEILKEKLHLRRDSASWKFRD